MRICVQVAMPLLWMVKDGKDRLKRIANDELEKCRLDFSRCTNRDVAIYFTL